MRLAARFLLPCLIFLALVPGRAQVVDGVELVQASLVPDTTAVQPGRPFQIGLRLKMADRWHTYWRYAGDAGLPTKIEWTLPEGFIAGPLEWPAPEKLIEPGNIVTYGYSDEVVLFTTITPPAVLEAKEVRIGAAAKWLVCADICIPGKADDLGVTMPVGESAPAGMEILQPFRDRIPKAEAPFAAKWSRAPDAYHLEVTGALPQGDWEFFPEPSGGLAIEHPTLEQTSEGLKVAVPAGGGEGAIKGVLVSNGPDGRVAWEVPSSAPEEGAGPASSDVAVAPVSTALGLTIPKAILFGVIGGLILNLMPCVLPVIALKIFGFMQQAGQSREKARGLGLAFVAGVFAWFFGLALLVTVLRLAGRELNWAFQFQHPAFVLGMVVLLFVFALNLLGVFEVYLPGRVNETISDASAREGYRGSFFHGMLATLLATPCTAPFLGPALGFAFSQSAAIIFVIFAAIAFGMSLPYILLSLEPGWIRFLPKPGAWMERVKQAMGFLLLGTVIFLLWVVGRQRGVDGMAMAATMLLMLGMAGWLLGERERMTGGGRRWVGILVVIFCGLGAHFFGQAIHAAPPGPRAVREGTEGGFPWRDFTPDVLAAARESGKAVFLDFTADWCVNCKWNERFVIETDPIREAMERQGVIPMQADWTDGDPTITAMLKSFGRVGVPLYVLYPPGADSAPVVLPELLTQAGLLDSLNKLGQEGVR